MDLSDPTTTTLLVTDAFERADLTYALYGALLLAAYGEPRETRDVDLAVFDVAADQARRALAAAAIDCTVTFEDVVFGGLVLSRLTLLGGARTTDLNTVDLVRPRSRRFAAEAVGRAVEAPLRSRTIRVLTPEDFVVFKLLSSRERDLADAASVYRKTGRLLDRDRVGEEVAALAREIGDFDVASRLVALAQLT